MRGSKLSRMVEASGWDSGVEDIQVWSVVLRFCGAAVLPLYHFVEYMIMVMSASGTAKAYLVVASIDHSNVHSTKYCLVCWSNTDQGESVQDIWTRPTHLLDRTICLRQHCLRHMTQSP